MEPSTSMHQGVSSKSHCGQEQTGLPKWNPKNKIFLSHSGEQKEFVRQLCKDLEAETHEPFFDERSSSLMMGERFAPLIFEAARQCLVAVVVLSEAFLTSKWPMLELVEFVKAKRSHNPKLRLFPLFYKLSPDDLKVECIESRWKDAWAKIITLAPDQVPLDDSRHHLSLSLCVEAIAELRCANGLKFENFASKVAYREVIVKEISLLVTPDLFEDISDVIGSERLCKILNGMFVEDTLEDSNLCGTYKLGLYGMGGLGKTTMSRVLCRFYYKHFNGRVCHVELGSRPPLDLQKLVLTKLLRINENVVKRVDTVHEGQKLLKDHMNRQPVFLVIDNITNDRGSQTEALAYLQVGFHLGSRIMITSRSLDIVEELFPNHPNATYCKVMASLNEEEARLLFLRRATPQRKLETLTIEEHKILRKCLDQCEFSFWIKERQYLPLALQAMADYYHKHDHFNLLMWREHLGDLDKWRLSNASSDVFGVLGLQFQALASEEKLIFLDLCLYMSKTNYSIGDFRVYIIEENYSIGDLNWLEDIHEDTPIAMKFQLQSLKRSGIIKFHICRVRGFTFYIHDLYKEFAKWYVKDGEGSRWCIYFTMPTKSILEGRKLGCVSHMVSIDPLPYALKRTSPLAYEMQRIWLENLKCTTFLSKKIQEWCNVVVLKIYKCSNLRVLNLHGLNCLCHLELVELCDLESFDFAKLQPHSNKGPNGTLESLQYIILRSLISLKQLPNFSLCPLLKTFWMLDCEEFLLEPPYFEGCSQLKYLRLDWIQKWQMEKFKLHTLTSLTSLWLGNQVDAFNWSRSFKSVGYQQLRGLGNWSRSFKGVGCQQLPGLGNWSRSFKGVGCQQLPGLGNCSRLKDLRLVALPITNLLGLEKLTKLQYLLVSHCKYLQDIPDLSLLIELKEMTMVMGPCQQFLNEDRLQQLRYLGCKFF